MIKFATPSIITMLIASAIQNLSFASSLVISNKSSGMPSLTTSSKSEVESLAKETFAHLHQKLSISGSGNGRSIFAVPLNDEGIYRHVELKIEKVLEACRAYERQEDITTEDISALQNSIREYAKGFFANGPFGREITSWPRGPGSSNAMRLVYQGFVLPTNCVKAHYAEWYLRDRDLAHAVRSRKDTLTALLQDELNSFSSKVKVGGTGTSAIDILDLANGPCQSLKDLLLSDKVSPSILERVDYEGFDTDAINQERIRVWVEEVKPPGKYKFESKNALIHPFRKKEKQYDIIYSTGLYDYLNDAVLVKIWKKSYKALKPGGAMLISLKDSNLYNPEVYTYLLPWNQFLQRQEQHFEELLVSSGMPSPEKKLTDSTGIILFYVIRKPMI